MPFSQKDIHNALHSLQMEGRNVNELEGLLVNSEDMTELIKLLPEYQNGMSHDGIRMFGVKIIESPYAQKGTVFRIFKGVSMSGMIQMPHFKTTVPCSGSINTDFGPITGGSGEINIPIIEPYYGQEEQWLKKTTEEKKKKEKPKHNYSDKRKIELD